MHSGFALTKERDIRPTRIAACVPTTVHVVVMVSVNVTIVVRASIVKLIVAPAPTAKSVLATAGVCAMIWTCGLTHLQPNIDVNVNHTTRILRKHASVLLRMASLWNRLFLRIITEDIASFIVRCTMKRFAQGAAIVKRASPFLKREKMSAIPKVVRQTLIVKTFPVVSVHNCPRRGIP
tara:strand:- start:166 stop:702 length:537 start_codon:yes stop_codon:yes gene_type:complete